MSYLSSLNASTLLAQSSLTKGTERAAVSMERLSTGLAVASAKDDPSAYYAGSTLGARIAWEAQATKNISDTDSLLNATDGAIEQVQAISEVEPLGPLSVGRWLRQVAGSERTALRI